MSEESWSNGAESSETLSAAAGAEDERFVLIDAIRQQAAIWDQNHENYKNLVERRKIFSEIAAMLTARGVRTWNEDHVKVAWKRLVDSQRRIAQRKRRFVETGAESPHSAWPYWSAMSFTLQPSNSGVQPMVSLGYNHGHRVSPYEFDEELGPMNSTQSVQAAIEDVLGSNRLDGPSPYSQMTATHIVSPTVIRESSAIIGDLVADTHRNLLRNGQTSKAQSLKQQILSLIVEFES
uniref:MADF domain-containing protein n=1 Tax=Steinernema glaseri TaxID=37863 RepID=A0A1I7YKG0_9BILA